MRFALVEPLRELFKDEVRVLGATSGSTRSSSSASRFPGPGLAVRILGAITRERLDLLRLADAIVAEEIRAPACTSGCGKASRCCCRCRASA